MKAVDRILGEAKGDPLSMTELIVSMFPETPGPGHYQKILDIQKQIGDLWNMRGKALDQGQNIKNVFLDTLNYYYSAVTGVPSTRALDLETRYKFKSRDEAWSKYREELMPRLLELAKALDYADYVAWSAKNGQDIDWL